MPSYSRPSATLRMPTSALTGPPIACARTSLPPSSTTAPAKSAHWVVLPRNSRREDGVRSRLVVMVFCLDVAGSGCDLGFGRADKRKVDHGRGDVVDVVREDVGDDGGDDFEHFGIAETGRAHGM